METPTSPFRSIVRCLTGYFTPKTSPKSSRHVHFGKSISLIEPLIMSKADYSVTASDPTFEMVDISANAPAKRKRGRPRKNPVQEAPLLKRPRGRPRKHPRAPEDQPAAIKRPRGRPRKDPPPNDTLAISPVTKRSRGRPRKTPADASVVVALAQPNEVPKVSSHGLKKDESSETSGSSSVPIIKRRRGRPRKLTANCSTDDEAPPSRKRARTSTGGQVVKISRPRG